MILQYLFLRNLSVLFSSNRHIARTYTRGAEKLFHRVDWERAVGLVVVVDPFDPGSLLYLPAAGYTDLIKTALANRSPLVVVHGLNDVVPTITSDIDSQVKPNVEYRVFSVNGKEVHRVPIPSQNSPLPMFGWPTPKEREPSERGRTSGAGSPSLTSPSLGEERSTGTAAPKEQAVAEMQPSLEKGQYGGAVKGNYPIRVAPLLTCSQDGPSEPSTSPEGGVVGAESGNREEVLGNKDSLFDSSEAKEALELRKFIAALAVYKGLGLKGSLKDEVAKVSKDSGRGGIHPRYKREKVDYHRILNDIRSQVGIGVYRTLRSASSSLSRSLLSPRPRNWRTFLPKELFDQKIDDIKSFPEGVFSPKIRPFVDYEGKDKVGSWNRSYATLLYLYNWAGATLTARSARSLQWSFQILSRFIAIWSANGIKAAVSCFDECTRILMKFLSGEIVTHSSGAKIPLKIVKGLPDIIPRGMRRYIKDGHLMAIRLAFFAFSVTRLIKYVGPAKLNTITDVYSGTCQASPSVEEEVRKSCERLLSLSGCPPRSLRWKQFHPTIKAGPMAKALISAPLDSVALTSSESAWKEFLAFSKFVKGSEPLVRNTETLSWLTRELMKPFWRPLLGTLPLGKLSFVPEPRGKTRVVAIPGYQIQSLLKPLHDSLYEFLERLETDHTHDQEAGVKRAMLSEMKVMNSYDLSAATDRFPKWFEAYVLKHLYAKVIQDSDGFAKAWSSLLDALVFECRLTPRGRLHLIKYGAGQPMGTYSSWASFAVSHHVVVQMAALRAGFENFVDYELLGDDIVLRGDTPQHEECFRHYREIMNELGLTINPLKGISSRNGTFEFAKRLVRGHEVLTGVRWKELGSIHNWNGVYSFLISLTRRGSNLPHLRVALEVGYALVNKCVYHLDLTDLRRVPLVTQRGLREALVLLCSPTGPYKVPFVGWLSFRGISYVDFHPNLGHFYNSIERVVMGHDYGYPIAVGINQVRRTLALRLMDARGVAFETLRALFSTSILTFDKKGGLYRSPEEVGCLRTSHTLSSLGEAIRGVLSKPLTSIGELLLSLGVFYKIGEKGLLVARPKVYSVDPLGSGNLVLGLIRFIIVNSPGFMINSRILRDLLSEGAIQANPDIMPDYPWVFQGYQGRSLEVFKTLGSRIEEVTQHVVPDKFKHPARLMTEVKDCITDYMKYSVADILPSCLPTHLSTFEAKSEIQASAVLKSWRALKQDATVQQGTIFTFPERTDRSLAPGYVLEYTNSIRLCAKPEDLVPRVYIPVRRELVDKEFNPLVYIPREDSVRRFPRKPVGEWYQQTPLNTGLQYTPEAFRSRLTDSGLFSSR